MGDMGGLDINATFLSLIVPNTAGEALKSYTRNRNLETIYVEPSNGKKETQAKSGCADTKGQN